MSVLPEKKRHSCFGRILSGALAALMAVAVMAGSTGWPMRPARSIWTA